MGQKFLGHTDNGSWFHPSEGMGDVRQEVWYEEHTDTITFRDVQDVDSILDDNRRELNFNHGKKFGNFTKIATIPNIIVNQLIKEGIWHDPVAFKKWLNKSEFSKFRTKEGQI